MNKTYTFEEKTFYHHPKDMFDDMTETAKSLNTSDNNEKYFIEIAYPSKDRYYFVFALINISVTPYNIVKTWHYSLRHIVHLYDDKYPVYFDNLRKVCDNIFKTYTICI